jgi:glycosyltransferase involved in cell wall biosynthesis
MKLSIIIPAHNEEMFIAETLKRISDLNLPYEKEVLVVDDGSTDQTFEILSKLKGIRILRHGKNLGKGAAIKTGIQASTGGWIIIQDADLEYNPENIPALLNVMSADTSAVYGKRSSKVWPKRGLHYVLGAKMLTYTINILFEASLSDAYTGYKLFNLKKVPRDLFLNLESSGFEFEAEITCKILSAKGIITEVPISYIPRSKKEGKHITWWDGLKGLWEIFKLRLRN